MRGMKDRIAGLRGLPENHDVARAVRMAQIQALERLIRDYRDVGRPEWKTEPYTQPELFFNRSLDFCARTIGRCLPGAKVRLDIEVTAPLAQAIDGVLSEPEGHRLVAARAANIAKLAEDAVIEELREQLGGVVLPDGFEVHFRNGNAGCRRFLDLFGTLIAEQIKQDGRFRAILTTGQLSRIEGIACDTATTLTQVAEDFARVQSTLDDMKTADERRHRELMEAIARDKGVDPQVLAPLFQNLGHYGLTLGEIRTRAAEAIEATLALARKPVEHSNDGADIEVTIGAARARLGELDTAGARSVLAEKIAEEETARRQRLIPLLEEQAAVERLSYDHAAAQATLRKLLALDPDCVWGWIDLGDSCLTTGSLSTALQACAEAETAARRTGNERALSVSHERIGNAQKAQGDLLAALGSYQAAHAIRENLARADPGNTEWQHDLSVSHEKIGDVRLAQDELRAALTCYRVAHAIREKLTRADRGDAKWQRGLSISHNKIGDVQRAQGDLSAALISYKAAHAIAENLAQADPGNAEWQRDLSVSHTRIGDVQRAQSGQLGAALTSYRAALAIREKLAEADPGNAGWQRDLSVLHNKIGDVQRAQSDQPEAALTSYRAALAIREKLAQSDPGNAEWQRDLIVSYVKTAEADPAAAPVLLKRALDIARQLEAAGKLAPIDAWMPGELARILAQHTVAKPTSH
ncbi:MAG: hypothetical protein AB7H90_16280 [Alphaproteobacteria bacterium]